MENGKWSDISAKEQIQIVVALLAFISAVVIGFIALYSPPKGVIDTSVLWFTAQMLVFVSTLLGLNLTIDGSKHFISNLKPKDEDERHHRRRRDDEEDI